MAPMSRTPQDGAHRRIGRILLIALLLAVAVIALFLLLRPRRPNLLLITLDTTRADHIGCYGWTNALTPALDRLAAEGVLFENAYATVPLTLPSHSTIMTGLLPPEHGLRVNGVRRLSPSAVTLARVFASNGYRTAAFIASTVIEAKYGLNQGFEVYDDRIPPRVIEGREANYSSRPGDQVADAALGWLRANRGKPFFCWVHLYDPHAPYEAHTNEFGARFEQSPYDGDIAFADRQVGRVLDELRAAGTLDRTIVAVTADHGESLPSDFVFEPHPHHGFLFYQSAMHVPLIVRGAGARQGTRIREEVSHVDLYPTLLELAHVRGPYNGFGKSLVRLMKGGSRAPESCYGEAELATSFGWSGIRCLVRDGIKYIRSPKPEFYDLKADPEERVNLAGTEPVRIKEAESLLREMESRVQTLDAPTVRLSAEDRRRLESLGYAIGQSGPRSGAATAGRDIKDMLPLIFKRNDALAFDMKDDYEKAAEVWSEVARQSPETFQFGNSFGCALVNAGRAADAVTEFERVKAEMEKGGTATEAQGEEYGASTYVSVLNNLAFALTQSGKAADALPLALNAVKADTQNASFLHTLAATYRALGRREEAFKYALMSAEHASESVESLLLLAELESDAGNWIKVSALARHALQSHPTKKEKEEAERLLEKAAGGQ